MRVSSKHKKFNVPFLKRDMVGRLKTLTKNNVFKNALLVGGITLFNKVLGFFKETMVAANFGLSELLDTYFIAFLIPGFIYYSFLSSFKSVFIPNYIAETKTNNSIAAFQGTGFVVTFLICSGYALVAILVTDTYLDLFFSGHTEAFYNLVKSQFYILLPCIFFWGFSSLISGLLNVDGEFTFTSFQAMFVPITVIVSLVFFKDFLGNKLLATGTLIGSILAFLFILVVGLKRKVLFISKPSFKSENVRLMFIQVPAKVTSSIFSSFHNLVDQYFAAQLVVGSLAAINYATKMPAFAVGIIIIAMNNVLLPHFSKLVIADKKEAFQKMFKIMKTLFIGGIIVSILGILTSDFFVSLFFERKEFTSEDTVLVANLQKIILIYIPFKICDMLLVNFLTSINKNYYMAIVSLISVVLSIILNFILIESYGVFGIAIATVVTVIIRNTILFVFTLKQRKLVHQVKS